MDHYKAPIWYEDLENQRQPCLYYLSSEEDPAGPHLICDWNGPPTDYEEFDLDIASKMVELKPIKDKTKGGLTLVEKLIENISQPLAPKINSSYTLLTEHDDSRLNYLTVPPLVNSLLKRMMRNQSSKSRPEPIPEEEGSTENLKASSKKKGSIKDEDLESRLNH